MSDPDEFWMKEALRLAAEARGTNEVPVGACVINEAGELIGSGFNRTITDSDPTAHAEILALREAASRIGNYRLVGVTVYTTIEPCVMCAGAMVNARVKRLVYGARDERFGAAETVFSLCDSELLNHRMEIRAGVLEDECRTTMQQFFRARRDDSNGRFQTETPT